MKTIKTLLLMALLAPLAAFAGDEAGAPQAFDISQTVLKMPLAEGVSAEDAIDSLRSKAVEYNIKLVAHQPLSKELAARGVESGRLEIFQFCNPGDAHKMVQHNPIFAAYMPCRIALVEDQEGQIWLMMMNLDMLINNTPLPPELEKVAENVNTTLKNIMTAAAEGAF